MILQVCCLYTIILYISRLANVFSLTILSDYLLKNVVGLALYTAFFCLNQVPYFRHHPKREIACSVAFFSVLNLLVERRKDIVWRIDATSIQIEPVQSSITHSGWGFINLQKAHHIGHHIGQELKKKSQQPRKFQGIISTVIVNYCVQGCIVPPVWVYNLTLLLSLC